MTRIGWMALSLLLALPSTALAAEPKEAPKPAASGSEAKQEAALAAAKDWLALVDGAKYSDSWDKAAELFRNAVPKETWAQQAGAVRGPLGKLAKRELKNKVYATSLPGAPDGEYVVIQFDASFANKKAAVETVTPMLDKDGKWRVSGYFVK